MKYRIRHITEYEYAARVSHCYNVAHMIPRTSLRQTCEQHRISIAPHASFTAKREDYFGNQAFHFEIQRPHEKLVITSESEVTVSPQHSALNLDLGVTCFDARLQLNESTDPEVLLAREFLLDSPMIKPFDALKAYALPSFEEERPLLSAVADLTRRIFEDFEYSPQSTTVATPLSEVVETRKGVCQDFAHLQIGCLRALGYPAKYVSGYIETLPPPGKEKLVGSDASHAWISVYSPREGWFEFDPTNNQIAGEQHIITAWGRDYFDVTPLRGVIFGGGENPLLNVSVDVARL
ncbi:transglutaminase family protein [Teredinibacter turnerae]|uniref:transglutaminase family protein n=1 Tax=Teredinibacter turnerae TaxID=2426 RepID=UPI00035D6DEC|nr:transglutaminase family protein [Teredinibacter turnerae]